MHIKICICLQLCSASGFKYLHLSLYFSLIGLIVNYMPYEGKGNMFLFYLLFLINVISVIQTIMITGNTIYKQFVVKRLYALICSEHQDCLFPQTVQRSKHNHDCYVCVPYDVQIRLPFSTTSYTLHTQSLKI